MTPEERYLRDLQIEGGLRELGLEHEPPEDWEERVFAQARRDQRERAWWRRAITAVVAFIALVVILAVFVLIVVGAL